MKLQITKEKTLPHIIVLGILLLISIIYFYPALQGNALETHDLKQYKGMSKEIVDFRAEYGEEPLWTNAMFGGMPTDQIGVQYNSNLVSYLYKAITLLLPRPISMLWMMFLGFYILLMCLKVDPWLALIGSIGFGFSSFFLVSLQAGHMSKVNAISFMAPTIAGFIMLFRGELLKGGIIAALFLSLQLWCNHPQITYYTFFIIGFIALYFFSKLAFNKKWIDLGKIGGISVLVVVFGMLTSLPSLWGTYEYGKETIRGKSELTIKSPVQIQKEAFEKTDSTKKSKAKDGLENDYILAWSYGTGETFTFMFPSLKGGGNNDPELKNLKTLYPSNAEKLTEKMQDELQSLSIDEFLSQAGLNLAELPANVERGYYGQQRLTNGPVFIGVIFCFLSLLALVFSDGKLNWPLFGISVMVVVFALLQMTLVVFIGLLALIVMAIINKRLIWFLTTVMMLTIFLAWGKNYLEFSEFFIQNFPLYNKFRSVTMILVVSELIIPLLGILFLYHLFKNKEKVKENIKLLYIGTGVIAFFVLVVLISPTSIFHVPTGPTDAGLGYENYINQMLTQNNVPQQLLLENQVYFEAYAKNMHEFRVSIIRTDALKALFFITAIFLLIFGFLKEKIQKPVFVAVLSLLVLIEMVPVGLDYLNNSKNDNGEFNYWTDIESELVPYNVYQEDIAILQNEINEKPWLQDSINARIKKLNELADMPLNNIEQNFAKMSILNKLTSFRVANYKALTSETRTSYFYKSLGGYHGAKLMSIQETFDFSSKIGLQTIFDMMNVKYIVDYDVQDPQTGTIKKMVFQQNPSVLGSAWIVDEVKWVASADEEMTSMFDENSFSPATTAIIDKRFEALIGTGYQPKSANSSIEMKQYRPNELIYEFNSDANQIVVFSEIYYKNGWQAYINDEPVDHFRTNYLLRGLHVPAGNHTIKFQYKRKSFDVGSPISLITSLILVLLVLYFIYLSLFTSPTNKSDESIEELIL